MPGWQGYSWIWKISGIWLSQQESSVSSGSSGSSGSSAMCLTFWIKKFWDQICVYHSHKNSRDLICIWRDQQFLLLSCWANIPKRHTILIFMLKLGINFENLFMNMTRDAHFSGFEFLVEKREKCSISRREITEKSRKNGNFTLKEFWQKITWNQLISPPLNENVNWFHQIFL